MPSAVGPDQVQSPKCNVPHKENDLVQKKKQKVVLNQHEDSATQCLGAILVTTSGKYRQRLDSSPARSHEFHQLELSRAWEPGDSSGTRFLSVRKGPLRLVSL